MLIMYSFNLPSLLQWLEVNVTSQSPENTYLDKLAVFCPGKSAVLVEIHHLVMHKMLLLSGGYC